MNIEQRFIQWAEWVRNPITYSCHPSVTREYRLITEGPEAMSIRSSTFGDGGMVDKVTKLKYFLKLDTNVREVAACIRVMPPAMRKLVYTTYLDWSGHDPVTKRRRNPVKPRTIAASELGLSLAAYKQKKKEAICLLQGYLCAVDTKRKEIKSGVARSEPEPPIEGKIPL